MKRRDRQQLLDAQDAGQANADDSGQERPSKSQLKREMHALQDLGEELLALQPSKLRALPLPPQLLDAIELARRINSREGLRRQRQYIGKLMRVVDPAPILAALDVDGSRHRAEVAVMHAAERWRERMLREPEAVGEFIERHPPADGTSAEALSGMVEAARAELARGEAGRRYRELYRHLRDALTPGESP
ncbi:MAG: hypothetical protein RIS35_573 [Pseudomonadota bacterium]